MAQIEGRVDANKPSRHKPAFTYRDFETELNPWGIHCRDCSDPEHLCEGCAEQVVAKWEERHD